MTVVYKQHQHDLPFLGLFSFGDLVRCDCGALFKALTYPNAGYNHWRRIGWFGKGWRRLVGRLP